MTGVDIPEDFLTKVYLGRCSYDYKFACSSPESQYTDFNVWDRFLSTEDLVKWTTCQSVPPVHPLLQLIGGFLVSD